MAIVTYPLNGITYNAEDAETYLSTRVSGVYASENCFDLTITADRTVTIGPGLALELVDVFLHTEFEGGRHQRRIDQITELENRG